jgi:hypothetical protein
MESMTYYRLASKAQDFQFLVARDREALSESSPKL